jgi:hypothetical protein
MKYFKIVLYSLIVICSILTGEGACLISENRILELRTLIWDTNEPNKVRIRAIQELISVDSQIAFKDLEALALSKENDELRHIATVSLGRYGESKIRLTIIKLLDDKSYLIRRESANIVGMLKIKEAYPQLLELLKDESSLVRVASIMALGNIGNEGALSMLVSIIEGSETLAKLSAIPSIGLILCQTDGHQNWIIDKVIDRLDDPNQEVRKKACYFLNDLWDENLSCSKKMNDLGRIKTMADLKIKLWSNNYKVKSCKRLMKEYDENIKKLKSKGG